MTYIYIYYINITYLIITHIVQRHAYSTKSGEGNCNVVVVRLLFHASQFLNVDALEAVHSAKGSASPQVLAITLLLSIFA